MVDREAIHIHDFLEVAADYPASEGPARREGYRTMLGAPLLREGVAIGVITSRRMEVRPFSEKQIALLKTFASKRSSPSRTSGCSKKSRSATRNCARPEHQTATSEVLGIISRSPTDVQPVLDAIVESAARVCGIDDVVLRLRRGEHDGFAGSFWSDTHRPRRDQY